MAKGKIDKRSDAFIRGVREAAKISMEPKDEAQMVWFLRHAFRMGWSAAKQDAYAAKLKKEAI